MLQQFAIKNQNKPETIELPADIVGRIFVELDWKEWKKISEVSKSWRFLVYRFSQTFSEVYFPYLKNLSGFAENPLKLLVKEGCRYEKDFSKGKILLILAALNGSKLIAAKEDEEERMQSYSLFLTNNDPLLVKNLTEEDQEEIKISAFKYYACSGQLDTIKKYLLTYPNRIINHVKGLVLQGAAKCNQLEIVKHLLLSLKFTPQEKGFALKDAARHGHVRIVKLLLPFPEITLSDKGLALQLAAEGGYLEIVGLLSFLTEITPLDKNIALVNAAKYNHFEVVKYLSSLRKVEFGKAQALITAAKYGYFEIVEFLLPLKEITLLDKNEALLSAAEDGHLEVVKCLISFTEINFKVGALMSAVKYGHFETAEYLLSQPGITPRNKGLALINAAQYGCVKIANYLLNFREITVKDRGGALINAARHGYFEIIKCLIHKDDKMSAEKDISHAKITSDYKGKALIDASKYGHLEAVKCLPLQEITDEDIKLARSKAVEYNYFEIEKWLSEKMTFNDSDNGSDSDNEVLGSLSLLSLSYTPLRNATTPEATGENKNEKKTSKRPSQ